MKNELTAKRLSKALSDKNMKPIDLANATGINKASISQYMNGTYIPSNINAGKIGAVLDVSPLWLMGLEDNPLLQLAYESARTMNISDVKKELIDLVYDMTDDQALALLQWMKSILNK